MDTVQRAEMDTTQQVIHEIVKWSAMMDVLIAQTQYLATHALLQIHLEF
jgi:hypothetical protein